MTRRRSGHDRVLCALSTIVVFLWAGAAFAEDEAEVAREAPSHRERMLERWQNATPEERRAVRSEIRERWEDASPRERRQARRRLRALERALPEFSPIERLMLLRAAAELPESDRKRLRRNIRGIDDLEPAERRAFLDELRDLVEGQAGEVERFQRNRERWRDMSDAERDEAREQMNKLREMSVEERRALLREMEAAKGR